MKAPKWILFGATVGMIAAVMTYLAEIRGTQRLDPPGVRVGTAPLYGVRGEQVASQSVLLPEHVSGATSVAEPITDAELTGLPKDTTFGRRRYWTKNDFSAVVTVVLMGTDRSSIHQPQFCLDGQGWTINETERVPVRIDQPYPYDLTAIKLSASMLKQGEMVRGIYVYWFVSGDKITADQGARLWSIAEKMVTKRELERWAYISYFTTCAPGEEEGAFARLKELIQASVPAFQVVAGQPLGGSLPVAVLR